MGTYPTRSYLTIAGKLEAFVDRSGGPDACWPWTRGSHPGGYGRARVGKQDLRMHREAWALANGPIPEGMSVLHTCDNPPCCNPAHLFLGTTQDNLADMHRKGRARGNNQKLTAEQVLHIRALYECGMKQKQIGARYGLRQGSISKIVRREQWKHV